MADFEFVDLRKNYNKELLIKFYNDMMVPNFGQFEDELEDVEIWIDLLENQKSDQQFALHVLLALQKTTEDGAEKKTILGGCACEYYPQSNCGLLTYIAVDPTQRSKGISGRIVQAVLSTLNGDAVNRGCSGLSALFLETNDATKVSAEKDVMDPLVRHKILNRLGFCILGFSYVQPALSPEQQKCVDLLLGVHKDFLKDEPTNNAPPKKYLESSIILAFMREFFIVLMGEEVLATDEDFLVMKKQLTENPHTYTLN